SRETRAKTPACSASTGRKSVRGRVVYVPSGHAGSAGTLFDSHVPPKERLPPGEIEGKIILTEGMAMPKDVADLAALGAKALIFINPGTAIHEGICTTIWGAPDLDSVERMPAIPVIAINRPDGEELRRLVETGQVDVSIKTKLDEGWKKCPLLVAEIRGTDDPAR